MMSREGDTVNEFDAELGMKFRDTKVLEGNPKLEPLVWSTLDHQLCYPRR